MFFKKRVANVELTGRAGLIYAEGERRICIDSELLAGKAAIVIYLESIKHWEPPYEKELISPHDIERIKDNLQAEFKDYRLEWQ